MTEAHAHTPAAAGVTPRRVVGLTLLLAFLAISLLSPVAALGQSAIVLRPSVRLEADRVLLLADIADLTGPEARQLAGFEIGRAGENPQVTLSELRTRLERNKEANFGRIRMTGSVCTIRVGVIEPAPAPAKASVSAPTSAAGPDSIERHIHDRVAALFDVKPSDVRLTFDPADAALLRTVVGGRTLAAQPAGSGDRVTITLRLFDHDHIVESGSVRVGVMLRRPVLIAIAPIARGAVLTQEQVIRDEQWFPPSQTPAVPENALGQEVRSRINAGTIIRAQDVEPPLLVKKGDIVSIDCVSGGFVVRTPARASENGREGQVITFQSTTSKHTFKARIAKAGLAVTLAPGETDSKESR